MEYNITYRQKDKGWQFIISYKINGKWKQKAKQGFKTKKDAKPIAEKMVLELKEKNKDNILSNDYDSITFKNVKDIFLQHKELYVKYSTYETYKRNLKAFTKIDNKIFIKINKADIQSIIDSLIKNGTGAITITNYLITLKQLLSFYKDSFNTDYSLNLKNLIIPKKEKKGKRALTKTELENLLKRFKNKSQNKQDQYIACLIASNCGLRFSEIMGLTWKDIDETNMTLSINKQFTKNKNDNWEFTSLKSTNSNRIVPIPINTLNELLTYKKNNITDINNRIITKNPNSIRASVNRNLNKAEEISIHELRHTYITMLIANNIDFKTVAKLAGHDIKETLETYSHVTNDMLKSAYNKVANIF